MIDLHPAAERMARLIANLGGDALPAPTPCPDLAIGDLVDHVLSLSAAFTGVARGEPGVGAGQPDAANLPADWRSEATARLSALADAWSESAAWEGEREVAGMPVPAEIAGLIALDELVVHGWDIAVASGQPYEATEAELAAAQQFVEAFEDVPRDGSLFGPAVPVADDAGPLDRLLGLTGRDPAWRP